MCREPENVFEFLDTKMLLRQPRGTLDTWLNEDMPWGGLRNLYASQIATQVRPAFHHRLQTTSAPREGNAFIIDPRVRALSDLCGALQDGKLAFWLNKESAQEAEQSRDLFGPGRKPVVSSSTRGTELHLRACAGCSHDVAMSLTAASVACLRLSRRHKLQNGL